MTELLCDHLGLRILCRKKWRRYVSGLGERLRQHGLLLVWRVAVPSIHRMVARRGLREVTDAGLVVLRQLHHVRSLVHGLRRQHVGHYLLRVYLLLEMV